MKKNKIQRVRLSLKEAYTWPSRDPKKPNSSDCNFIKTSKALIIGDVVSFEQLKAHSNPGDLNEDHYRFYQGKIYQVTVHANGFFDLIEC
jgi:hypothetical protein